MSSDDTSAAQAGQIWRHRDNGMEVLVTRVTEAHVHYSLPEEAGREQVEAVETMIDEAFEYSLVSVTRVAGAVESPMEFEAAFAFDRMRELEPYES